MTMRVRAGFMLIVAVAMGLTGCGHYTCGATFGSSTCTPTGSGLSGGGGGNVGNGVTALVYIFTADQLAVEALNLNNSGTFLPLASLQTPAFPTSSSGVVAVDEKFIYVPLANNTLYGFSIDVTTGGLTPVTGNPHTVDSSGSIASDPTGRFLFVAGFAGISVFTVNSTDGSLALVTGSPFSTGGVIPTQMATDGQGKFLYGVQGSSGTEIIAFSYDATGVLTTVPGSPFQGTGFNMAEVAGESSGKYLLGITQQSGLNGGSVDNNVYVFTISPTGVLTELTPPFATTASPINIAVSPNGRFVYTFNQNSLGAIGPMEGFQFDNSTGALTALTTSPFTGLNAEIGHFDQSGLYLFAVADEPNLNVRGMFPYTADPSTGALTSTFPFFGAPTLVYAVTDVQ